MSRYQIRPYRSEDDIRCRQIAARAAMTSYGRHMPELAHIFREDHPLDDAEHRLVATCDAEVVGLVEVNGSHIENLFVATAHQGQGLGTLLLKAACDLIPTTPTLSVFTTNPRARTLYERHGFKVTETRTVHFHGHPKPVWLMRQTEGR